MEGTSANQFFSALPGIWVALLGACVLVFAATALVRDSGSKTLFWTSVSPLLAVFLFLVVFIGSGVDFPERSAWEWILPKEDIGALRLSFDIGPFTAMVGIAFGLGIFSWIFSFMEKKKSMVSGALGASILGYAGVLVSWSSNSTAFALLGISFSFIATTYALQMSVNQQTDSKRITLFLLPRLVGIFVLVLGFMGFASLGLNLDLGPHAVSWMAASEAQPALISAKILIGLGFFLLLQPFPGAGALWLPSNEHSAPFSQTVIAPIPVATFALLFRMHAHFVELELWTPWVFVMLIAGLLIAFSQFFQNEFRGMVRNWAALGPILCAVVLGLAGKAPAIAVLLGWILLLPVLTDIIENGKTRTNTILITFVAAGSLGMFGFFPAIGNLKAYAANLDSPGFLTGLILLSLGSGGGLWRIIAVHFQKKKEEENVPISSAFLFICALLLGGWVLSGTWSGGFFYTHTDSIEGMAQLEWVKEYSALLDGVDEATWMNATLIHAVVLVISILLGYFSRTTDLNRFFPKLGQWVRGGFGIDHFGGALFLFGERASAWFTQNVSDNIWDGAIPKLGESVASAVRKASVKTEKALSSLTQVSYSHVIDTPAKLVQLIQSGDSHWYLFFCVLSAVIALMHFIRF